LGGQTFSYILGQTALRHLHTSMLGEHQLKNAAVALTATMTLNECGFNISEQQMHSGLAMAKWPGRFEVMSTTPLLIMDGAHNTHGMKALVQTIDELLPNKKAQMVTGIMKDKEVRAMLSYLEGRVEKMYVSAPIIPRAMPPHELGEIAQGLGFKTECYESIARALSAALEDCPNDSYVLVAGSLYAVSEARQIFNEQKANGSETGCC
ncbi:MAG: cyanophycin synthetase, partial [bacterium]|nr:cyanophycin synthetase [bacterium]